jgi:L-alanine-DL-glutamate epimerase-like enolase superfamily enzyme
MMRIAEVKTRVLKAELSQPFGWSFMETAMRASCLVEGIPLLEFDRSEHPVRQAVLTAPIEHLAGVVAIPAAPGLGIEVDRASIERFTTGDRCGEAR